uniref:Uncharacterized protein n=1 Tax=Anguilla anguilla TaxID=7936 RepID=A0A0E9VCW9_ANGAN
MHSSNVFTSEPRSNIQYTLHSCAALQERPGIDLWGYLFTDNWWPIGGWQCSNGAGFPSSVTGAHSMIISHAFDSY